MTLFFSQQFNEYFMENSPAYYGGKTLRVGIEIKHVSPYVLKSYQVLDVLNAGSRHLNNIRDALNMFN